jgi:hypothetical protein
MPIIEAESIEDNSIKAKTEDMTNIVKQQQAICEYNQSAFCPILPDDMVAVALQTLGKTPIYGVRVHKVNPSDNVEWFFYCGEFSEADDFYKPLHAQHLGEYLPMVEKYLALAPGYRFIIDADGYEDVWLE